MEREAQGRLLLGNPVSGVSKFPYRSSHSFYKGCQLCAVITS